MLIYEETKDKTNGKTSMDKSKDMEPSKRQRKNTTNAIMIVIKNGTIQKSKEHRKKHKIYILFPTNNRNERM